MYFSTQDWDLALFQLINQEWRCVVLDVLMPVFSMSILLFVLAAVGLVYVGKRFGVHHVSTIAVLMVLTLCIADVTTNVGKELIGRVRPLNAIAGTYLVEDGQWQQRPGDFVRTKQRGNSYPSGHAANSMAFAMAVCLLFPLLRPWVLPIPCIVAYSRIYLGKHYPSDVLAGLLLGTGAALFAWMLWRYIFKPPEITSTQG